MKKKKSLLALGMIFVVLVTALAFLLFIRTEVGFLGWLIMLMLSLFSGFLTYMLHARGIKVLGFISLGFAVAVLLVFLLTGGPGGTKSSAVSDGVDRNDLGNIMNGQFYFDDGDTVYYSNYDDDFNAHIYEMDDKTGANKPIFDGFGWSLVTYKGYLYFSGNEGDIIDGTYRLYKMNLRDYSYEIINEDYCYNMSLYDGWLYFINRDSSGSFSYRRMKLRNGSMETIVPDGSGRNIVVYDKMVYYLDSNRYISRSEPDGSNPEILVAVPCDSFIIGNGRLIYATGNTIMTCDANGEDRETVTDVSSDVYTMNSKDNTIFFTLVDENAFDSNLGGYPYELRSVRFNGKGERLVYEGTSWGVYINIVGKKVYALDYVQDQEEGHPNYVTIISMMDIDGDNPKLLAN